MNTSATIDLLNELLAAEQCNLVTSLMDSTMFVSHPSVDLYDAVSGMARASREHERWIAETVLRLGGVPGLRMVNVSPADLHFQEISAVLPRLAEDRRILVQKFENARLHTTETRAVDVIGQILEHHREEYALLGRRGCEGAETASA